jgi:RNA polymerase sigma-70 factor (TIGR02960 family)
MSGVRGMLRFVEQALDRARTGDELAFRELTEPYRRELLVHCYRMLGSLTDAEDVLQETLLAAWRGLDGFQQRSSLRSWLYRIATNQCLNALRAASRRVVPEPVPPFRPPEPTGRDELTYLQPFPDAMLEGIADTAPSPDVRYQAAESVELAFVTALQRMPPRQTATIVLRDVLGFGMDEVADMLGTSSTAIKGMLQRARATVDQHRDQQAPATTPVRDEVARRFADAFVAADVDRLVALLTDDAWLSMPPAPHQYVGREAIAEFFRVAFDYRGERRLYAIPARANTQRAFGTYLAESGAPIAKPAGLIVLGLAGDRVRAITRFHLDELYPRFGLPASWPSQRNDDVTIVDG